MNTVGLFIAGVVVTLIVCFALGICVWGAILDGRDEEEYRQGEAGPNRLPHPPADSTDQVHLTPAA